MTRELPSAVPLLCARAELRKHQEVLLEPNANEILVTPGNDIICELGTIACEARTVEGKVRGEPVSECVVKCFDRLGPGGTEWFRPMNDGSN